MDYFVIYDYEKNQYVNEHRKFETPYLDPDIKSIYKSMNYVEGVLSRCLVFNIGVKNIVIKQLELKPTVIQIDEIKTKVSLTKQKFVELLNQQNIFLNNDTKLNRLLCSNLDSKYIVVIKKITRSSNNELKKKLCKDPIRDDIYKFIDSRSNNDIVMLHNNNDLEKIILYKLISSDFLYIFDRETNELQ